MRTALHTALRPGVCAVLLTVLLGLAGPAVGQSVEHYEMDVLLAPVRLDGEFPLAIRTDTGSTGATLTVVTDVKGKLTGSLELPGVTLDVTGKVKAGPTGTTVKIKAQSLAGKLKLKGELSGDEFAGTSKGKGDLPSVLGSGTFALDCASAGSTSVLIGVTVTRSESGKLKGDGSLHLGETELAVGASGKRTTSFKLKARTSGFSFSGKGLPEIYGATVDWKAEGFGAKTSGEDLEVRAVIAPGGFAYPYDDVELEQNEPMGALTPTFSSGTPGSRFSVTPALPVGLELDPRSGVISGFPTALTSPVTYRVSAANAAGSTDATVRIEIRISRAESLAPEPLPLSEEKIRHFLARTRFGATADEYDEVVTRGLADVVEDMLVLRSGTTVEAEAEAYLVNDEDPPGLQGGFPSTTDLARWWTHLIVHNPDSFQEVIALLWHDHFATSTEVLSSDRRYWMKAHVNLFRHRGLGNLRDLLVDVSRDWAMLRWLDGDKSTADKPNENYAREFWELFTLGVDNGYTQADILEAARAFTGYRDRLNEDTGQRFMVFETGRHDPDSKTIFGVTIPAQNVTDDVEAVVDITLANRPAAEFICRKLFEYFCYVGPPDAVVAELASTLRGSGWELKPVVRKILLSEAFFSERSRTGLAKSPIEYAAGLIRSTGLEIRVSTLDSYLRDLGHRPTQPPTVDGWPEGALWFSAQGMVDRANLANVVTEEHEWSQKQDGITAASILPASARTAAEVVDTLVALLNVKPSEDDRTDWIDFLNTSRQNDGTVVTSPFDRDDANQVEARVRGLLYILAQHPTYHLR
jgi:uncharacterized protein (DUF1800 family)